MRSRYRNFSYSLLTNEELATLAIRVCTKVDTDLEEDEFLKTETAVITEENSKITNLKARSESNEFTHLIMLSDKKRDMLYRVIKRKLKNDIDLVDYEPAIAELAEKVLKMIEHSPVDLMAGYSTESDQLNRLFEITKQPENAALIMGSSVAFTLEALENEQREFERLQDEQTRIDTTTPTGEVRKHIATMIFHLKGVLSYLELSALSKGAQYETTAAEVEDMITAIMAPARSRATKKDNEIAE